MFSSQQRLPVIRLLRVGCGRLTHYTHTRARQYHHSDALAVTSSIITTVNCTLESPASFVFCPQYSGHSYPEVLSQYALRAKQTPRRRTKAKLKLTCDFKFLFCKTAARNCPQVSEDRSRGSLNLVLLFLLLARYVPNVAKRIMRSV